MDSVIKIDEELIKRTAEAARLKLSDDEIKRFLPHLKDILNAFSELDRANTDNTSPSFHPVEIKNVMRDDGTKPPVTGEESLSNAKEKKDGYFKGPMAV